MIGKRTPEKLKKFLSEPIKFNHVPRKSDPCGDYSHFNKDARIVLARKFAAIRQRCNNPNSSNFFDYGGRGIKCEWTNLTEFLGDMYDSYFEHLQEYGHKNTTIDRINPNGNYCRENCRWATQKQQSNNNRNSKFELYL